MELPDFKDYSNKELTSTRDRLNTPRGFEVKCPSCGSERLFRDGWRKLSDGSKVQRYLCRECGYRFTEPSSRHGENHRIQILNRPNGSLKIGDEDLGWAGSGSEMGGGLVMEKPLEDGKWPAGGTVETSIGQVDIQGKIVEFLWWMRKQGYKNSTIISRGARLKRLIKLGADLLDPESVKRVISLQDQWSESRKEGMVYAYDLFAKWMRIKWDRPIYKPSRKLPFIPLEREIDDLIAGSNKYIAAFLQIAKESGARAGEIFNLKWVDVDFERQTLSILPEKGSEPRIFKISSKLLGMLNSLPRKGERIFSHYKNLGNLTRTFERYRRRIAYNLGNPRLLRITFHTLRHWKATMEYHKTKDILHVMQLLGHKNIKNTLIYTQLVKGENNDEFICKAAKTVDQASRLIEAGFDYVCEIDGIKLFRKRK